MFYYSKVTFDRILPFGVTIPNCHAEWISSRPLTFGQAWAELRPRFGRVRIRNVRNIPTRKRERPHKGRSFLEWLNE